MTDSYDVQKKIAQKVGGNVSKFNVLAIFGNVIPPDSLGHAPAQFKINLNNSVSAVVALVQLKRIQQ